MANIRGLYSIMSNFEATFSFFDPFTPSFWLKNHPRGESIPGGLKPGPSVLPQMAPAGRGLVIPYRRWPTLVTYGTKKDKKGPKGI